jgi:hypothetical protein
VCVCVCGLCTHIRTYTGIWTCTCIHSHTYSAWWEPTKINEYVDLPCPSSYICMCACMHVCEHANFYVHLPCPSRYVFYVRVYVCVHACIHTCMQTSTQTSWGIITFLEHVMYDTYMHNMRGFTYHQVNTKDHSHKHPLAAINAGMCACMHVLCACERVLTSAMPLQLLSSLNMSCARRSLPSASSLLPAAWYSRPCTCDYVCTYICVCVCMYATPNILSRVSLALKPHT